MYKVIIVEDEDPIRRGLECAIPWTELDCTVVGGGRNGLEGIRAIEELAPDIVIVDINMPIHRRRGDDEADARERTSIQRSSSPAIRALNTRRTP